jgi:antitoxin ParD1/3/4
MAMVKKSITVTDKQEAWIQSEIAAGNYGTDSELIREALREKKNRTAQLEAIRAALIEGEDSGFGDRTVKEIRKSVQKRLRDNGQLPPE